MKIFTNVINIGGVLAMAMIVSPLLTSNPAQAYACKGNSYIGAATQNRKMKARAKAKKSWETAMKNQFDLSWSLWSIAASKSIQCHKTGSKHTCQAQARPCNYVVN